MPVDISKESRRQVWRENAGRTPQVLGLLAVCLYIYLLHLTNDGLWFQGDSPRHAANGFFWWDLMSRFPTNPVEFAKSYYARYPVIQPIAYPPLFYLLEGLAFRLLGPSAYVGKTLVFGFAILSGIYMLAWLRRWISPAAGWGAVILILQPGVIRWSNAVMLNVPSMALGLAALYHTRSWLESRPNRHQLILAMCFGLVGILTYFQTAIIIGVIAIWVALRIWQRADPRLRSLMIAAASASILLLLWVSYKHWSLADLNAVFQPVRLNWTSESARFYYEHITEIVFWPILCLAGAGALFAVFQKAVRTEVSYLISWIAVCYVAFSGLSVRDTRYLMVIVPALVALTTVACLGFSQWWGKMFRRRPGHVLVAALIGIAILHLPFAWLIRIPNIQGFREVAAFLKAEAPTARFLYDGNYDGIFSFQIRAQDPHFRNGVTLGDKLIYSYRFFNPEVKNVVNSAAELVELLKSESGCSWIVVEKQGRPSIASARLLREAVTGPEFEHVKTFYISSPTPTWIDVYRFLSPVKMPQQFRIRGWSPAEDWTAAPVTP